MLNFEEFTENVWKGIRKKADGIFHVSVVERMKNNGIRLTGISAVQQKCGGGPCVYLDSYYREYQYGNRKMPEIVDEVYSEMIKHKDDLQDVNMAEFLDWDTVRGCIYMKLVNAGRNGELLGMVPHRTFLDLAAVYYIAVNGTSGNPYTGTALICNHHMSLWKQEEEKLYGAAVHNMRSDGGPVFENIWDVMERHIPGAASGGNPADMGMYILTNCRKHYGASEILDQNSLKGISDKMKGDFIVLPSSVHEVIVLASKNWMKYKDLASVVREVNAREVSAEEFLSDHVYVYNRRTESLSVAA